MVNMHSPEALSEEPLSARYTTSIQDREDALKNMLGVRELPSRRLTRDGINELGGRIHAGEEGAREELVLGCLPQAFATASWKGNHEGHTVDDVFQYAALSILETIASKSEKGKPVDDKSIFFSIWRGAGYVTESESSIVKLPIHFRSAAKKVDKVSEELAEKLGREPTTSEIAVASGIGSDGVKSINDIRMGLAYDNILPLELAEDAADDGVYPEAEAEEKIQAESLQKALEFLPERERHIVIMRWGLAGEDTLTLEEIGSYLGVTRERIRQLGGYALKKLSSTPEAALLDEQNPKEFIVRSDDPEERAQARKIGFKTLRADSEYDQSAWNDHPVGSLERGLKKLEAASGAEGELHSTAHLDETLAEAQERELIDKAWSILAKEGEAERLSDEQAEGVIKAIRRKDTKTLRECLSDIEGANPNAEN